MSKPWTLQDDLFLAEFHEIGPDFIASHDLGFSGRSGSMRVAKLKSSGVWEKLIAHKQARADLELSWSLAFSRGEAQDIAVRELRTTLGITQSQLADALGLDQSTISNWENGHQRPRGPARKLLASLTKEHFSSSETAQ